MIFSAGSALMSTSEKNVLGTALIPCSYDPLTGHARDGCCNTDEYDLGTLLICVRVTADFLAFSGHCGNDLITPQPARRFAGLKPGDRWCLCADCWREALAAGVAPPVVMESTHMAVLDFVDYDELDARRYGPGPR